MLFKPKTKLRSYQAAALKRCISMVGDVKGYGLFLAPRTGKSKIAIDFASYLFLRGKALRAVIIAPLSSFEVWEDELAKHCAVPYRLLMLPRGSREQIAALNALDPATDTLTFVLMNWEASWRIEEAIVHYCPDVLLVDEAHKMKNRTAKQSRAVHRLVFALDPYRVLLTGSSISNSPLDVFSQYLAIDTAVFGQSYRRFEQRYATFYGMYNQKVKYRNLPDLRRRAREKATVLTKEECLDLPPSSSQILHVELTPKTRAIYEQMKDYFIAEDQEGDQTSAAIVLTQILRLLQISGGFIKTDDGETKQIGTEKLDRLADELDSIMVSGEKAVVFARFRAEIEAIDKMCKKHRWRSFKYYGGSATDLWRKFRDAEAPAVFIAQNQTGSLSIDLATACYAIFYSFDHSLINWEQCHERIALSRKPVTYLYLLAKDTRDELVFSALKQKKRLSQLLENRPPSWLLTADAESFD